MERVLAIDIGNTNITAGFFVSGKLFKKIKIPTAESSLYAKRLKAFTGNGMIDKAVIASVVPQALGKLRKVLPKSIKRVFILGKNIKVPIKNLYRIKSQVGQDRLVNAFAANKLYGAPCVVVDFGTAVTFDIVSKKGEYLGGLIMPGIRISLESLYERTALLPKVSLKASKYIIGKDTVNSMRGGILFGFGAMCDGLVARYKKILGKDLKVIATGGNAGLVKNHAKYLKIINEDLTLKGLYLIYHSIHPPSP